MKCDEFDELIQRSLDEWIAPEAHANLRRHARGCHRCRAVLNAYGQLLDGLQEFEPAPLKADFARSVVTQAVGQVSHPAGLGRWTAFAAVALAASVLLAALPLWRTLLPEAGDSEPPRRATAQAGGGPARVGPTQIAGADRTNDVGLQPALAANALGAGLPTPPDAPATGLPSPATAAASSAPAGSPDIGPRQFRAVWDLWSARWRPEGPRSWTFRPPPVTWDQWYDRWKEESRQSFDPLADGLAPIATSLTVAIDEIRNAVPLGRDVSPSASEPRSDSARDVGSPSSPRSMPVVG